MRLALVFLFAGTATAADDLKTIVDPIAKRLLDSKEKIGFVVGVRNGKDSKVFGYGTVKTPCGKVTPDGGTIFEIGSITKTFTGVLLADAIRRGELKLADSASMHLPADVPLPPAITLEHLATHHGGLTRMHPFFGLTSRNITNPYADYDRKKLHGVLAKLKPDPPGEKSSYSNLGAGIVGIALVRESKLPNYDALVKARITQPLGMSDTAEALTGEQKSRLAVGHDYEGTPTSPWDFACLEACGGLRSSANDMLLFAAANLGHSKEDIVLAMKESQKPIAKAVGEKAKIGLFWQVRMGDDGPMIWHNGGTGGFNSMLCFNPKTQTAVVLLCAAINDKVDQSAIEILNAIQPK